MKVTKIILLFGLLVSLNGFGQCDFVNGISGIALSTPPSGNSADPALFTQTYVLVDEDGNIVATSVTPDFPGLAVGLYNIYAINYDNNETAAVVPLLVVGQPWEDVEAYGDNGGCLDYTGNYGGCFQSVCDEIVVDEDATVVNPSSGFNTDAANTQEYCLVCGGNVIDINSTGTFDLTTYPAAVAGADCEIIAMNYLTSDGAPVLVGQDFATEAAASCGDCWDFIGRNLVITSTLPVNFLSFEGEIDGPWNLLTWVTASEQNCDYYLVERSHDGVSFENIGKVNGGGNSETELHYRFFDKDPLFNTEYYRLKQVDFNGDFEYTPLVALTREDVLDISLYPNPADWSVNIDLKGIGESECNIVVLDANGKMVHQEQLTCSSSMKCSIQIPTTELDAGIYCAVIQDNTHGRTYQRRFVKK